MVSIRLTDVQRTDLEQVSRQAVGRVALRAQLVLLADRGHRVPQSAAIQGCGQDVVRTWLHRSAAHGVAGLADRPRRGRPPRDRRARHLGDAQARQSPRCAGLIQTCWTVALLATCLAARFGRVLAATTVRRHRTAAGWRWRRPRLAPASCLPAKRDPDAEGKRAAITTALRHARCGACHLRVLDEGDLHRLPVLRACWMTGPRLRVPTPGTTAQRACCGALDAVAGVVHRADHERTLAVPVVAFLQRVADTDPAAPRVLVMDTVQPHHAKVVRAWLAANPRVSVLWLPTDAAHDAHPVARIWGLMKGAGAATRLAGSRPARTNLARRFFATLAPHPVPASLFPGAA